MAASSLSSGADGDKPLAEQISVLLNKMSRKELAEVVFYVVASKVVNFPANDDNPTEIRPTELSLVKFRLFSSGPTTLFKLSPEVGHIFKSADFGYYFGEITKQCDKMMDELENASSLSAKTSRPGVKVLFTVDQCGLASQVLRQTTVDVRNELEKPLHSSALAPFASGVQQNTFLIREIVKMTLFDPKKPNDPKPTDDIWPFEVIDLEDIFRSRLVIDGQAMSSLDYRSAGEVGEYHADESVRRWISYLMGYYDCYCELKAFLKTK